MRVAYLFLSSFPDFSKYPVSDAGLFYDLAEFHYLTTDQKSLDKLLKLGDIFVFEPTGNYSWLWQDNLIKAGKEFRLVPHQKTRIYRELCGWSYKDDEHDAIALAYYGWQNLDNLRAFNRIRRADINKLYYKVLEKERIVRELRPLINRSRQLLHREFPEVKNAKENRTDKPSTLWLYISNGSIPKYVRRRWDAKLSKTIGTAKGSWFSHELIINAHQIVQLQQYRADLREEFDCFMGQAEYQWIKQVFDEFWFNPYDQVLFLCQIDPFEQFLDDDGKELRIAKRRKQTKSGYHPTKRVGLNRFHARLGKAVYPWSSGNKVGHIVTGSQLARNALYLWANLYICMRPQKEDSPITEPLIEQYHKDKNDSSNLITALGNYSDSQLSELKQFLSQSTSGTVLLKELEKAIEQQANPLKALKKRGTSCLSQWAKARVTDKLVKMLFKHLLVAYRQR